MSCPMGLPSKMARILFAKPVPTFAEYARLVAEFAKLPDRSLLLPHPVAAPVALPAGEAAAAELQIEPVLAIEEAGAAGVAEGKEDFIAGPAADVIQRLLQCA